MSDEHEVVTEKGRSWKCSVCGEWSDTSIKGTNFRSVLSIWKIHIFWAKPFKPMCEDCHEAMMVNDAE